MVEIGQSGGGRTHGKPNRWVGRGADRVWSWLICLFAGTYAEAFCCGLTLSHVMRGSGRLDLKLAAPAIEWLVKRGHAKDRMEALRKVHTGTIALVFLRLGAIEVIAASLLRNGRLTPLEVRQLAGIHPGRPAKPK